MLSLSSIILTNISRIRPDAAYVDYMTDDMGVISGRHTNEAPIKYLLNAICNESPDDGCTIIAITTKEAEEALTELCSTITSYSNERGLSSLRIEQVPFEAGKFGSVISEIVKLTKKGDRVYIDTTGGFRDSVYLLMAVVRILEYSGIKLEKAVYAVYNAGENNENRITDITDTYNMFNLINAANSFTSLGNSDDLARFFSDCENSDIKRIIDVMNRFSDEVALCRTSKLDGLLTELNNILINLQGLETDVEIEILFKSISGAIRDKFNVEEGRTIDYVDVICWCLDNKMIQQAVTIYVEKMPEFIYENRLISYKIENIDERKFNRNFDKHYNLLYSFFLKQETSITHSKYPLGNLLKNLKNTYPWRYKEICDTHSINELSFRDDLSSDERRGLINLIRVKNAIFLNPNTRRSPEEISRNKENTKLSPFADSDIFEERLDNTKAYLNKILGSKKYLKLLQGSFTPYTPRVWNASDINVIEHLEKVLEENKNQCAIKKGVSHEDIKELLRNLVYVKRFVRNSLNHASEENNLAEEYNEYFGGLGYNVKTDLSVKDIESVIREAVALARTLTR